MIKKEHSQLTVLLFIAVNISIHFAIFSLSLAVYIFERQNQH